MIGQIDLLPGDVRDAALELMKATRHHDQYVLILLTVKKILTGVDII